ncbi:MAG: HEPN domain-containing protein [Candidatus Aenigmarchaeota archaeon]|nr:HEPN domain-containing protein [Candidatus Aenigmarchaeota archaeon]
MTKIDWCLNQKDGLTLIESSQNLAKAYVRKAEESLESIKINTVRDWKISTAYYTMYFSLYAILMRIGVKCGIHSCTIEFAKQFMGEYFSREEMKFLSDSLGARIDAQYYVDRSVPDEQFNSMLKKAPEFLVKCKAILLKLDERKVNEIRTKLKSNS